MSTQPSIDLTGAGAAYLRISDDQQDTQRQYDAIHAFQKRHNVVIAPECFFKDEGYARDTAARRPDFQRLLKLAEEGRIKWIVVSERDRFGTADADEFVHYRYLLRKYGCRLYDCHGTDWTKKDIATVITAVVDGEKSEKEQHGLSERVLGGKAAGARNGEWQGSVPRLGFDVACYQRDGGQELWRVVYEGFNLRLKVYPDGRTKRFDGPDNFPPWQNKGKPSPEFLRLAPSIRRERVEAAISVFKRFAEESISPTALARSLNGLGFRTACGGPFQGHHVRSLLEDPIYLGYPAWNRRHYGKFHRYVNGEAVLELNHEERQSPNDRGDWVYSRERLFDPLVERSVWDAVQEKLSKPRRVNAPRSADNYLAGLAYCGNCGSKMEAGLRRSRKRGRPLLGYQFYCGGYHRAVRSGLAGCTCKRNSVYQHELREYVDLYLEEVGTRLEKLTGGLDARQLTAPLEGQEEAAWQAFRDGLARLTNYLAENCPEQYAAVLDDLDRRQEEPDRQGGESSYRPGTLAAAAAAAGTDLVTAHAQAMQDGGRNPNVASNDFVEMCLTTFNAHFDRDALEAKLVELRAEHDALVNDWRDLPTKRAKDTASAKLTELDAQMAELERQRDFRAETVADYYREMCRLNLAVADARTALRGQTGERAMRHLAQQLRGIIQRIECTFTVTGQTGGGHRRNNARLLRVSIYPLVGEPRHFDADSSKILRATRATSPM
jgi:DNA invertase Pin-like site-specific DNA recombinase